MAYSVNWITKVVTIPTSDLTLVSGTRYQLIMSAFHIECRRLESAFIEGLWADDILDHTNTKADFSGTDYAPFDEVINGYTITFQAPATRVDLIGSNNNIVDIIVINGISIVPSNSAGLITANIDKLKSAVETLHDSHASYGKTWYYDPTNGNDTNPGDRDTAGFKTWTVAEAVMNPGDRMIILADPTTIPTISTERIATNKKDVHLVFPSPHAFHVVAQVGDDGAVLQLGTSLDHAAGSSVRGGTFKSLAATGNGIQMFGDGLLFKGCRVDGVPGDSFHSEDCSNTNLIDMELLNAGDNNINIVNCDNLKVLGDKTRIEGATNEEIKLDGTSKDTDIGAIVVKGTGTGILIAANCTGIKVNMNARFIGLTNNIIDNSIAQDTNNEYELKDAIRTGAFANQITINPTTGVDASKFPAGTLGQPCKTIANALSISQGDEAGAGIRTFHVQGDISVLATDDISGYNIESKAAAKSTVTLVAGCVTDKTWFGHLNLTGALNGTDMTYQECHFDAAGLTGINGDAISCLYRGSGAYVIDQQAGSRFHSVGGYTTATRSVNRPDFQIGNCESVAFRAQAGSLGISNMSGTDPFVCIDMISGGLNFAAADNTTGQIICGDGARSATPPTNGTVLVDLSIKSQTEMLRKANFNKRKHDLIANTITLYEDDKVTPYKVFDATDELDEITPQ